MNDKSNVKKVGKSIKEKRADKRNKGSEASVSEQIHPPKKK